MLTIGHTRLVNMLSSIRLPRITTLNGGILSVYRLILASLVFCSLSVQAHGVGDQDPQVAWKKIDSGAVIIDVRTAEEFAYDHLDKALNIPFELIIKGAQQHAIDKSTPIVVYCRSGRRSGIAYEELTKAGYLHVYNGGGLVNLKQYRAMYPAK